MTVSLDPAVEDALDSGQLVIRELIRFDLPGHVVGYHRGGRPYTYNGLEYRPNRFLDAGEVSAGLGIGVSKRTLSFSNIPSVDPDETIAQLENYAYGNATVIVTALAGILETDEVAGILYSSVYEIDEVRYLKGAVDPVTGERLLGIHIDIEPPGRSARGSTHVKRSDAEQRLDNSATDTGFEYIALGGTEIEEWGQVSG